MSSQYLGSCSVQPLHGAREVTRHYGRYIILLMVGCYQRDIEQVAEEDDCQGRTVQLTSCWSEGPWFLTDFTGRADDGAHRMLPAGKPHSTPHNLQRAEVSLSRRSSLHPLIVGTIVPTRQC